MLDADRDQSQRFLGQARQRRIQRVVHRPAPVANLVEARPADHPAPGPLVPLALAIVIAVKQERPAFVVQRVTRHMVAQDKGLEEPGGVGEMPFGGRCVGMRLDRGVGVGQRSSSQRQGQRAGCSSVWPSCSPKRVGNVSLCRRVAPVAIARRRPPSRHPTRGDEQMVGQAVEVRDRLGVDRFGRHQRDRRALGPANDRTGEVQRCRAAEPPGRMKLVSGERSAFIASISRSIRST